MKCVVATGPHVHYIVYTTEFREKRNLKPANNMKSYLITILIGWNKRYNLFLDHPSASYMLVYISSHAWPGRKLAPTWSAHSSQWHARHHLHTKQSETVRLAWQQTPI